MFLRVLVLTALLATPALSTFALAIGGATVIAVIEEGAAAEAPKEEAKADKPANDKKTDVPETTPQKPAAGAEEVQPKTAAGKSGTPSKTEDLPPGARFTAAKEGIDPSQVEGTGRRGALTQEDMVNYASGKKIGRAHV